MALKNLAKGTHSQFGEKLDWSYYDQIVIAAATLNPTLFQVAEGQGTPAKTRDQTNMTANGQIPTGQRMTIHRIKLMYTSVTYAATDLKKFYDLLTTSVFRFIIPGKDSILTLTLQELLGAATLNAVVVAATNNQAQILPYYHGQYPLNKPIVLAEQTQFHCEINHYAAPAASLAGDVLKISLNGILERRS